jgi:two-component system sensor kinase FixL
VLTLGSFAQRLPDRVWRYGLVLVSVAAALAITDFVEPFTTLRTPLFYIAIIISAWFGGFGPGLMAVAFSTVALDYFFAPDRQIAGSGEAGRAFTLLFSLSALLACWVAVQRKKAEKALQLAHDELEERVRDRTSDLRRATEELQGEIAERQRGEQALREQARLLDLTHDAIFVRDTNDVITYWNHAAEELYGWTKQEAVGKVSHQLMQTIFPAPVEEVSAELRRTGRWEGELVHTRRDGAQVTVASRWSLHYDEGGRPAVTLETNNDISERKRAEEALNKMQAELAHVTRVTTLGEMTASIAHEINQPLAAVVNNANACLRWLSATNVEMARQSAERIVADGHRAGEIISRIRALAKKAPPRKESVHINEIITEVIALARSEIDRNHVSLKTQLSSDLPAIFGDRVQLQQVTLNLIINAVEAMSGASGDLRVLFIGSEKDESQGVLVSVRDSGPGLEPGGLNQIFTAFYTTKPHGMGMGLAISRSIIEAHGGRLWATANEDRGAVFHFSLPVVAAENLA